MPSEEQESAIRRLTAAKWIESVTGIAPSASSDLEFRHDLSDGVLLAAALNEFAHEQVVEVQRLPSSNLDPNPNLVNFISAWSKLQLPLDVCFSEADFALSAENRPQVVECVLTLKHRFEIPAFPTTRNSMENGTQPQQHHSPSRERDPGSPGGSPERSPNAKHGSKQAMHNTVGVTKLMQQCTSMLREKMWNDTHSRPPPASIRYRAEPPTAAQPESALEAMGPVLESVLGSLTQEYEKRLLLKDQEMKTTTDQLHQLKHQVMLLESEARKGEKVQIDSMTSDERDEYERLRRLEEELEDKLAGHNNQLMQINHEYEQVKLDNMRLDIVCKEYQAKVMAGEQFLLNYKSIQDENRKMYNLIQDLRGNIRVFCRVRPAGATGDYSTPCVQLGEEGQIALYHPSTKRRAVFAYDKVFPEDSTQEDVYYQTQPLIRSVLDGYNVCIFAYGQTGSGKTHTMAGTNVHEMSGRGINYRTLDDLFDLQHQRKAEVKYVIKVQMLEVYNEQVRDLLVADEGRTPVRLEIQNTKAAGTNVPDAIQIEVSNTQDVFDVMARGAKNRSTHSTKMNERSSRSHSVLTIVVDGYNTVTGVQTHGCLSLVDLAGSERVSKSEATGDRLEEAKFINKSLAAIGDVMSALANKLPHIPFRNSKLTQLLAESLQGQAKVMMFVHIAPESSSHSESCSTLKFGARVSEITLGQAKKHVESGSSLEVKENQEKMSTALENKNAMISNLQLEVESQAAAARRLAQDADSARRREASLEAQLADLQAQVAGRSPSARSPSDTPVSGRSPTTRSPSFGNAGSFNNRSIPAPSTSRRTSLPASSSRRLSRPSTAPVSSVVSPTSNSPSPRTPGTTKLDASQSSSGSAGSGTMTAEERHISRMRAVMEKAGRGTKVPLPIRPRTAQGVSSVAEKSTQGRSKTAGSMSTGRTNGAASRSAH